jgi:hypothetical protein
MPQIRKTVERDALEFGIIKPTETIENREPPSHRSRLVRSHQFRDDLNSEID